MTWVLMSSECCFNYRLSIDWLRKVKIFRSSVDSCQARHEISTVTALAVESSSDSRANWKWERKREKKQDVHQACQVKRMWVMTTILEHSSLHLRTINSLSPSRQCLRSFLFKWEKINDKKQVPWQVLEIPFPFSIHLPISVSIFGR